MTAPQLHSRYRGTLLGLGLGSALGQPVEFMSPEQVRIKHGRVRGLLAGGWRGLRRGEPTPEVDLTLLLAAELVEKGRYDRAAVAARYAAWFAGERRPLEEATHAALALLAQGVPPERAGRDVFEHGRGKEADAAALLRTVPLVLFHRRRTEALVRDVLAETGLTHYGAEMAGAAVGYGFLLLGFLEGGEPERVLERAHTELARRGLADPLPVGADPARPRTATGRPADNLAVVWAAVCEERRAVSALSRIVSGGEDAATAGALGGALLGARWGDTAWPAEWTSLLVGRHRFLFLADELLRVSETPAGEAEGGEKVSP